jgi:hypothetical protein
MKITIYRDPTSNVTMLVVPVGTEVVAAEDGSYGEVPETDGGVEIGTDPRILMMTEKAFTRAYPSMRRGLRN